MSVEQRMSEFIASVLPDYEVVVAGTVKSVRVSKPTAVIFFSSASHQLISIGAFAVEHDYDVDVVLLHVVGFREGFADALSKMESDVSKLIGACMINPGAVEGHVLTYVGRSDVAESSRFPGVVRCKVTFKLKSYSAKES